MRLKLFCAPRINQAIAKMRAELGDDALILSTRQVGGGVEITAAIPDETDLVPVPRAVPTAPAPAADHLVWHGIPPPLAARLRQSGDLSAMLAKILSFVPLPLTATDGPVLLAGPPGAGKTLTIARLATQLVRAGCPPYVITTDANRAGAAEDLSAYTHVLGLSLVVAPTPDLLRRALARRPANAPALIDTAGADGFCTTSTAGLADLATAAAAHMVLALPAGIDAMEAADLADAYAACGAAHLLPTRLDLARRIGCIVTAAIAGNLPLCLAGTSPSAASGLTPITAQTLAARLGRGPTPLPECS